MCNFGHRKCAISIIVATLSAVASLGAVPRALCGERSGSTGRTRGGTNVSLRLIPYDVGGQLGPSERGTEDPRDSRCAEAEGASYPRGPTPTTVSWAFRDPCCEARASGIRPTRSEYDLLAQPPWDGRGRSQGYRASSASPRPGSGSSSRRWERLGVLPHQNVECVGHRSRRASLQSAA